jgi:hypothetical protein
MKEKKWKIVLSVLTWLEMVGLIDGKSICGTFTDTFDSGVVQFGDFIVSL